MTHRIAPGLSMFAILLAAGIGLSSPATAQNEDQSSDGTQGATVEATTEGQEGDPADHDEDRPDAAMVLDSVGTMDPEVEAFTTLPQGTEIALSDDAELEFLDLKTCDLVRVAGGVLVLGETISHKGGTVLKREPSECPESFDLEGESEPAGVILRSIPF